MDVRPDMLTPGPSNETKQRHPLRRVLAALAIALWAAAVGASLAHIWSYKSTPGRAATAPASWPGSRLIERVPGRTTLVMFAHPRCSCTSASLQELNKIVERAGARLSVWVLFLEPGDASADWHGTPTMEAARRIPGVTVLKDREGEEAARFGAETSGQVVMYAASGELQFEGGITGSRGHVGDNLGEQRVMNLLAGRSVDRDDHAVFGCALHERTVTM